MSTTISAWLPEEPRERASYLAGLSGAHLLALAGSLITTQLSEALRPFDLQLSDWVLLGRLYAHPGALSAGELATGAGVRASTVSTALARLSRRQLVTRRRPDDDQRTVHVHLTEAGRMLYADARPEINAALTSSYGVLAPEDDGVLRTLLTGVLLGEPPR
ncbi:MarR family winged helix-turn-helix transcriptional regulator [Krasilnikovia sp. MM14-A1004]|uniref:MarR family winged helix-turn-helix transcriptional regulator n=1 Tax=Krasilnikovia sp. MM14-A1004 TaxID=3373541 RepID=UPI00399D0887